jgi:uncharacterized protein YegL
MKTSVVVLAVLSLAILVSVSGRNVVQARDVWPGPDGVTATDGIHPGEAVITWSTVEKAAYYRIGWVAQADREVGTDGDAKWREGFVFADVANRGQASHLITGLTPGVEYDFVVASHDGRWSRLPGTGGLASLRLGEDPSYFRLFDSAEAEVALEPVEEGRYRRIGWITEEAYRNAVDGDGDWRRSVQFMDLANRGQTSQVITGLKLGAEYYVAVASHDDPWGATGWPDAGEWELVTARSAWQSVSFQNSETCAAQDMLTLPTGFEEGIATYLCQDDAGENYWIFVPTGYTDPDAVVKQLHGRAFDELGEVDNRVEAYRSLIVEVASQKAFGERAHLSVFFDFNEGSRGPITAADEIIGDVIDAYALGYQEDSQQYRDLENHLGYLLEHSDIYDDQPFGSIEFDAAIMAAVSRTIFIDQTREHVRLLEQLPMDSAWAEAIEEAQEILNRKSSGDDLTEWGEFLEKYHDEIVQGLHVVAEVGAKVAAHAIGTALGIAGFPVAVALSAVVFVGFQVYERIHETNEFWDDLTLATVAAQAYWHTYRNRRDEGAFASEARRALLGYTEFSFYQHLYLAADNPLTGASPIGIGNLGETNPSEFVQTLLERRDLVLDRLIDSAWEPTRDFKPLYDATGLPDLRGLNEPTGMWSDGDTMWVSQKAGTTLRAFDMETKLWVEELDFDTARPYEGISFTDIWSDEETMWIAARLLLDQGSTSGGLYAYEVTSQQDDATQSLYTLAGRNHLPWGVWSNGTTIWVSNTAVSKIYAYDLATRQRDRAKDFDGLRLAGNDSPHGIWSNEKTMWVADREDDKVYAYDLATARRDPTREFNLVNVPGVVTNTEPGGIWSDRTSMWVIDGAERKIFAYALPEAPAAVEAFPFGRDPAGDLGRLNATENHHAEGIWSDGTTMWVADHDDDHVYAYRLSDGARVEELEFDLYNRLLFEGNHHARGIWSDGTTMWVADHDDDRIYAYRLSDGARIEDEEYNLRQDDVHTREATGIWSDAGEETMWVADRSDKKIYGYDLSNPNYVRLAGTIGVLDCAGNDHPRGIWSDGATMWVGDDGKDRIYAYSMRDNLRDPSKEFDILAGANNRDPRGIWSDGDTMWVADDDNDWVYAYNMPDKPLLTPVPAIPGTPSRPIVAPLGYPGVVIPAVVIVKWTASANANFHLVYLTSTDGTEHRYLDRVFCGNDQNILVVPYDPIQLFDRFNVADRTAAHYPFSQTLLNPLKDYQFRVIAGRLEPDGTVQWSEWSRCSQVIRPDGASEVQPPLWDQPTDLCMLSVGPAKLEPAFKTGERNYSATTVQRRVTITPASDQGASFTYSVNNVLTRDGDPTLPGFQADLECGANTVEIKVASADGEVSDTYTIDVTRETGIPPEAPVFSQVFGGPESLQLRFPPADSNCAGLITWYYFRYSEDGVNWQVIEKRFYSTQFSISDLTPGTAYRVQAQARTKYGVSPWSATATGTPKIKPARNPADAVGVLGLSRAFVGLLHDDLEIVYVVDTSGSMSGSKLDQLKIALASVRDKQGVDNTAVALVRFSTSSSVLLNFVETGAGNWNQEWTNAINGLAAVGSTEMYAAMRRAVEILPAQDNCPTLTTCRGRDIVLMTDGQAGDSSLASTAINEAVNKGVQVHTVAFGTDAEEAALQNIATQTGGTYVKVQPE